MAVVSLETVVPEAPLEETEHGLVPAGEGWFVVNAREALWKDVDGLGPWVSFEGEDARFADLGINITLLRPGQPACMSHAEEAHRLRELADARNVAESLAYQTERTLKEHREKLDEGDASTIEGRVMELKGVLESDDVNEIRSKTEALQEASQKLAEAVYAQATSQTHTRPGDTDGNGAEGSPDEEEVEEADYEVIDEEEAKTS